jgi:CheY-like chemotaxis protein
MPEMDGEAFLDALQTSGLYNCIPVIVMTGDEKHFETISEDLQTRFIAKPFSPEDLMGKIEELFQVVNVAEA